jgi:hypothetical protein
MGLWDRIMGDPPIETVEWVEQEPYETLVSPVSRTRIKYHGVLIVREGQAAVFTHRGHIADVFGPGRYTLDVTTLPVLASFKAISANDAVFRTQVYFVSTSTRSGQPWLTPTSIVAKDTEFGTVRAKASGTFGFAITDPAAYLRELQPGENGSVDSKITQLHNLVVSRFGEMVRTGDLEASDLFGGRGRLGLLAGERIASELAKMGVTLTRFTVGSITLPPEIRRPHGLGGRDGEVEGYVGTLPQPVVVPEAVPGRNSPGAPATPRKTNIRALFDALGEATVPPAEPVSKRIPLAEVAPEGVFSATRPVATGPKSERLHLPDTALGETEGLPTSGPASGLRPRVGQNSQAHAHAPEAAPEPVPTAPSASPSAAAPPPLPAFLEFYVALGGASAGPFDLITLSAKAREGSFGRTTLVWRQGMECWETAESVPELALLFRAVPPPLPPS